MFYILPENQRDDSKFVSICSNLGINLSHTYASLEEAISSAKKIDGVDPIGLEVIETDDQSVVAFVQDQTVFDS